MKFAPVATTGITALLFRQKLFTETLPKIIFQILKMSVKMVGELKQPNEPIFAIGREKIKEGLCEFIYGRNECVILE